MLISFLIFILGIIQLFHTMVLNIAIKIIQNKYFINKKDIRNEQNDLHTLFLDFLEFEMKKSINR